MRKLVDVTRGRDGTALSNGAAASRRTDCLGWFQRPRVLTSQRISHGTKTSGLGVELANSSGADTGAGPVQRSVPVTSQRSVARNLDDLT